MPTSWLCSAIVDVATTTFRPRRDRRREVGEALARPGRRLGDEMVPVRHRVRDRGGELALPVALLPRQALDGQIEQFQRICAPRTARAGILLAVHAASPPWRDYGVRRSRWTDPRPVTARPRREATRREHP